ncbi:TPA: hypothetical protein ACH3X2_012385 [Trebouxia sp. C0005]
MSNNTERKKLFFCSFEQRRADLCFNTGCWRKCCRRKQAFYSKQQASHTCGAPESASTLTYIYEDEALSNGYRLVQKTSEEGRKLQSQTNWRTSDFVWVPANLQGLPAAPKPRAKRSREAEEYQVIYLEGRAPASQPIFFARQPIAYYRTDDKVGLNDI